MDMNTKRRQVDYQAIDRIEQAIARSRRNSACFYPHCRDKPIRSHVIAESMLRCIAEKSHVLTWLDVSGWELARAFLHSPIPDGVDEREIESLYEKLNLVGVSDKGKVAMPLFCDRHDGPVFASLENSENEIGPREVVLLAFRSICATVLHMIGVERTILEAMDEGNYHYSKEERETLLHQLRQVQSAETLLELHNLYGQMLETEDYSGIGSFTHHMHVSPCIAASYTFFVGDGEDRRPFGEKYVSASKADFLHFSLLPGQQGKSTCVISWLKGSQGAKHFLAWHGIHSHSEEELYTLLFRFALEAPMPYISPVWWRHLSIEEQFAYTHIHRNASKRHAEPM